jgi:hypothetical protein
MKHILLLILLAGCSTSDITTSGQVANGYNQLNMWNTNPALATVGVYTPAVINAINPPPKIDESVNYLVVKKCGGKPCKKAHLIPRSQLPTKQDIEHVKQDYPTEL